MLATGQHGGSALQSRDESTTVNSAAAPSLTARPAPSHTATMQATVDRAPRIAPGPANAMQVVQPSSVVRTALPADFPTAAQMWHQYQARSQDDTPARLEVRPILRLNLHALPALAQVLSENRRDANNIPANLAAKVILRLLLQELNHLRPNLWLKYFKERLLFDETAAYKLVPFVQATMQAAPPASVQNLLPITAVQPILPNRFRQDTGVGASTSNSVPIPTARTLDVPAGDSFRRKSVPSTLPVITAAERSSVLALSILVSAGRLGESRLNGTLESKHPRLALLRHDYSTANWNHHDPPAKGVRASRPPRQHNPQMLGAINTLRSGGSYKDIPAYGLQQNESAITNAATGLVAAERGPEQVPVAANPHQGLTSNTITGATGHISVRAIFPAKAGSLQANSSSAQQGSLAASRKTSADVSEDLLVAPNRSLPTKPVAIAACNSPTTIHGPLHDITQGQLSNTSLTPAVHDLHTSSHAPPSAVQTPLPNALATKVAHRRPGSKEGAKSGAQTIHPPIAIQSATNKKPHSAANKPSLISRKFGHRNMPQSQHSDATVEQDQMSTNEGRRLVVFIRRPRSAVAQGQSGSAPQSIQHHLKRRRLSSDSSPPNARLQDQPQATEFVPWRCRWKGCDAALHSHHNLVQHCRRIHCQKSRQNVYPCRWTACANPSISTRAAWEQHMAPHLSTTQNTCERPGCGQAFVKPELLQQHACGPAQKRVGKKRSLSPSSDSSGRSASPQSASGPLPGSARSKLPKRKAAPPSSYNFYEVPWSSPSGADRAQVVGRIRPEAGRSNDELMELTRHPGWQDGWDLVEDRSLGGSARKVVQIQGPETRKEWFTVLTNQS